MNIIKRMIFEPFIVAICISIVGCALLVGSYCIPTGVMRQHVAESIHLINSEEMYLRWNWGYVNTQIDGQSEYDLYGMAINEDADGNVVERAMFMYYPDGENLQRNLGVAAYATHEDINFDQRTYTRYWNGSVIFIKLLLLVFSIPDIRMLNFFSQMILLLVIIWVMAKQGLDRYIMPFVAGIIVINPFTMALSVKYAAEYIPMLLAILTVLLLNDSLDKSPSGWHILFALIGSVTSFLCMLSFPGITLGIPLLFYIWKHKNCDVLKASFEMICSWGIAYAVTWSMKWTIGTLVTGYNFWQDAINQMFKYQGSNTVNASAIDRLKQTLWCIYNPVFLFFFIVMILIMILLHTRGIKTRNACYCQPYTSSGRILWANIVSYMVVAFIPFAIILGLGNGYAFVHAYMAHRHYAMTVTAGLCMIDLFIGLILNSKWMMAIRLKLVRRISKA